MRESKYHYPLNIDERLQDPLVKFQDQTGSISKSSKSGNESTVTMDVNNCGR